MQNFTDPPPITILIVDDDALVRRLIQITLRDVNCICLEAHNGYEAVDMVQKRPFDIILLDIMMPGINGFNVCRQLKTDPQTAHIPIVLVTALKSEDSRRQGAQAGADGFVTKPFNKQQLLAAMEDALAVSLLQ